jgi:hypothetical protein
LSIDFTHRQSAHCESGVTSNLLRHAGIGISEAMAFGIGGGLLFGYFPFVRINHLPLLTYRTAPGAIFKKATTRLGVRVETRRFRDPSSSMAALDASLETGTPVGLQTGVFWLPYFPPALRFHFNAHNLVVFGREGGDYLISDPVLDEPVSCPAGDLARARFAEGALAPKGRMFHIRSVPQEALLRRAVLAGIGEVGRNMVKTPIPLLGVRGIRFLARQLESWPGKLGERRASQYLGHMIRMQEEIGTGGGGFRFIYSAFLQEAAELLQNDRLLGLAESMTGIGDLWREFALLGARHCKGRGNSESSYPALGDILRECAAREESLFRELLRQVR